MELVETYGVIRRYFWAILLFLGVGLLAGVLLFVAGPRLWKASGQMLAQPGAAYRVQWVGNTVDVVEEAEMWGTLQQLAESRTVAVEAARRAGILQDEAETRQLRALAFERGKRGNIFKLTAQADTANDAQQYCQEGMQTVMETWDQTRLERASAIEAEVRQSLERLAPQRQALVSRLAALEEGPPAGKPPEVLAATEQQITELSGAIATAEADVGIARERVVSMSGLARRERIGGVETPTGMSGPAGATSGLETRLADLEAQRRRMLVTRTESHPEVVALDREIDAVRQELGEATEQAQERQRRMTTPMEQQMVLAQMEVRAAQRRVQALRDRQNSLRERLPALQSRAARYAEIQEQLAPLNTQRDTLMANLRTLSNEVQRLRGGEDLRIVDPAEVVSSNRTPQRLLLLALAGAVAGIVVGILLAFLLNYIELGKTRSAELSHAPG